MLGLLRQTPEEQAPFADTVARLNSLPANMAFHFEPSKRCAKRKRGSGTAAAAVIADTPGGSAREVEDGVCQASFDLEQETKQAMLLRPTPAVEIHFAMARQLGLTKEA